MRITKSEDEVTHIFEKVAHAQNIVQSQNGYKQKMIDEKAKSHGLGQNLHFSPDISIESKSIRYWSKPNRNRCQKNRCKHHLKKNILMNKIYAQIISKMNTKRFEKEVNL